ncbi:MAG: hypothetical protein NC253_04615 [Ruminococcus sp.]|nr:hypothetical protein [Ruminococcus sp.]MCM1381383.1 hypothetical protein [Muribaculaceae bacterium]MCM1479284.1 hypothetical protein [Muribaculaceae bacterium]
MRAFTYRKILLGTVLAAAVCLSACEKETEIIDDFTTTTAPRTGGVQTVTAAETAEKPTEIIFNPEGMKEYETETDVEDKNAAAARQYFTERGFTDFYAPYSGSEWYCITADMNGFDGDPFEDVDNEHLKAVYRLTLKNVDGHNLDFLSRFEHYDEIVIKDYSGSADFGAEKSKLIFDNYMGGDLSTVDFAERFYSVKFENYSGEYPLNNIPKEDVARFDFTDFADGVDFGFIAEYPNVSSVWLSDNDIDGVDMNFIKDCKNLKYLSLTGKSADCAALAEILPNSSVKTVYITVEKYSSEEAELIMKAIPSGTVTYNLDSTPWDYTKEPTEGVAVFANMRVNANAAGTWDCKVSEADGHPGTWGYGGSLVCTFSNFTEKIQTVNSVRIFRDEKGKTDAMTFADGNTSYELDFAIDPDTNSDLDITGEIFPFADCETGVYKVVFDVGGEQLEQRFFIFNGDDDFLTEEQREVFDKAYEITNKYFGCSTYLPQEYADAHTAEEFLKNLYGGYTREYAYEKSLGTYIDGDGNLTAISGDKGGDISVQDHYFMPVYADENEVLFKNFIVHGHEDYPYYIWFAEQNYHMVKTADGWRFDEFDLWF